MNNLSSEVLLLIFEKLNLSDLVNCSHVCKKWNQIIKPKNIFVCYGTKFINKKYCSIEPLFIDQTCFLEPYDVFDKTISTILNKEFLKSIETFIYYGNGHFIPPDSFNFYDFPKLKYLEIMDYCFCNVINFKFYEVLGLRESLEDIEWKFFSPSIETLFIYHLDINMLLLSFKNLKFITIYNIRVTKGFLDDSRLAKWESFTLKCWDYYMFTNSILDFLLNKAPFLKAVDIFIKSNEDLNKLLNHTKLEHICVKIPQDILFYYTDIISKNEKYLNNDYKLCINNIPVKSLDDFKALIRNNEFSHLSNGFIEESVEYDWNENVLLINNNLGIEIYEYFSNKDCIQEVQVCDEVNNLKISLPKLFKVLPNIIKKFTFITKCNVSQETMNLLPKFFPDLEELTFFECGRDLYDFQFILKLNYLKELMLKYCKINFQEFIKSIKKLYFLKNIIIYVEEEDFEKTMQVFMNAFHAKKLPYLYRLSINEKCLVYENSSKNIPKYYR